MRLILTLLITGLLAACASPRYTVDDGRKVDEALLANIRTYGSGEQALRPAIVRSAALQDPECDTQWELPFSVATSYGASEDERVAWVRGLGVDERLTVVGTSPETVLKPGDKIRKIGAFDLGNADKMLQLLEKLRDAGTPFDIQLAGKKIVKVVPFKVCRGYTRLAPPNNPAAQEFHWQHIVQPLEVARAGLSEDEALWIVLWDQGISEQGGAKMKLYHYGTGMISTLFTLGSGLHSASLASEAGANVARSAASSIATSVVRNKLISQAVTAVHKLSQQQVKTALQRAAANRAALSGINWAASTAFEKADAWAYNRLELLGADPLASFSLHQKLIEQNLTANSMVFDLKRLKALYKIAADDGNGEDAVTILQGVNPDALQF